MKWLNDKKIAGVSVVEALVAALVVGLGIMGLVKLQGELFQGDSKTRLQTQASNSAQQKIEELRSRDYNALANGNYNDTVTAESTALNRSWTITDCINTVNCKEINVMVAWVDGESKPQQINLASQIGNLQPEKSGIALAKGNHPGGTNGGCPGTNGSGKNNKGHGNNEDRQDDDNPGQGGGGPNAAPKDQVDEDEGAKGNQTADQQGNATNGCDSNTTTETDGGASNKGHGNNLDGQDDDNPGQGGGGPNAAPKDGVDEDEGAKGNTPKAK